MTAYFISLATTGVIFSIVALGLNVRWGWAGEFDIALLPSLPSARIPIRSSICRARLCRIRPDISSVSTLRSG